MTVNGTAGFWVASAFMLMCVAVGMYDLFAIFSDGKYVTASTWLVAWSAKYPLLPLAIGALLGHLFIPSK